MKMSLCNISLKVTEIQYKNTSLKSVHKQTNKAKQTRKKANKREQKVSIKA